MFLQQFTHIIYWNTEFSISMNWKKANFSCTICFISQFSPSFCNWVNKSAYMYTLPMLPWMLLICMFALQFTNITRVLLRSNSVFNCCGEFCSKLLTTMTMNVCLIWVNEDWSLPSTEFLASFWILEEPFHGFLVDVCWFCTAYIYHFYRDKTLLCLASTALYEKYQGLSHPALFCKTPRIQDRSCMWEQFSPVPSFSRIWLHSFSQKDLFHLYHLHSC